MDIFKTFGVEHKRVLLENGSELHLIKREGAPVHIQACVRAGTRYNTIPGLAHFLEHMMVAGTSSYPSKIALTTALENVGGYFEASTDSDMLKITVAVPQKNDTPLALTILDEMLTTSLFKEEVFKNEQAVILREQKDRQNNNTLIPMDTLMDRVYPDFGMHFQGLGTSQSVLGITLSNVVEFASTNITAERTVFVVSGDVEIGDVLLALSSIKLPRGLGNILPKLIPSAEGERVIHKKREGENSDVLIGFRCDVNTPKDIAGLLLIHQMCFGRSSRFIQELRYNRGLVYSGGAPLWSFNGTSVFGVRTTCATEKLTEVFDIMVDIFKKIYQDGISESECDALKIKIEGESRFTLQASKEWAYREEMSIRLGQNLGEEGNALTTLLYVQQMDARTLTEIFRKYFDIKYAYGVVVGSPSEETMQKLCTIL